VLLLSIVEDSEHEEEIVELLIRSAKFLNSQLTNFTLALNRTSKAATNLPLRLN